MTRKAWFALAAILVVIAVVAIPWREPVYQSKATVTVKTIEPAPNAD